VRRRVGILVCALLALALAAEAGAQNPPAEGVRLRGWYAGWQWTGGARDRWDVFGRPGLPPAEVDERGRGVGFMVGHRFGGRFLLGLQVAVTEHDLAGLSEKLRDTEGLLVGTVLFRERATLQPFLRGGFGVGAVVLNQPDGGGQTTAIGTATVAGAGVQVRLSSRFSLELEGVANFTNFIEVKDDGGQDWSVKTSHFGWRVGVGVLVWF